jgi:uncharacterized protein (TIGR00296 family)
MIFFTFPMISNSDGEKLVRMAREAVETFLRKAVVLSASNRVATLERMGVFVTLSHLDNKGEESLRGCVGFPLPEKELSQSVVEAAIAAATNDPRFPPLVKTELPKTIFEVSLLTCPQQIQVTHPAEYYNHIKIGRDGLILKWENGSGLLLPQVAKEWGWSIDQYLLNICYKAGTTPDVLALPESKLYKFQAQVYREYEPMKKVIRLQ